MQDRVPAPRTRPTFWSTGLLAAFVWCSLLLLAAGSIVSIEMIRRELGFLDQYDAGTATLQTYHHWQDLSRYFRAANGLWNLGVLLTAFFFIIWLSATFQNLRLLSRRGAFTPRRAALVWFIPVVNLVAPYLAVFEAWRLTSEPGRPVRRSLPAALLLLIWWLAFLAIPVVIELRGGPPQSGDTAFYTHQRTYDNWSIALYVLSLAAGAMAMCIVSLITAGVHELIDAFNASLAVPAAEPIAVEA